MTGHPVPAAESPYVWVDPARYSGQPCIGGTRIPTASAAQYAWHSPSGVDAALEAWPDVRREQVLVACWYEARFGLRRELRSRWAAWAEAAGEAMWHAGDVDYGTIPDPPDRTEINEINGRNAA